MSQKDFSNYSDSELNKEIARRAEERRKKPLFVDSPQGTWKLTTEGDCEGRSTKTITNGSSGHLAEVLLKFGSSAYYAITVESVEVDEDVAVPAEKAMVYGHGILNSINSPLTEDDLSNLRAFFGPKYKVKAGQYFNSFELSRR